MKKRFTPLEASQTLPLVRQIVRDILSLGDQLREMSAARETFSSEDPEAQVLIHQLNQHFAELEDLGCSYRDWDFSAGLVDFPSIIDGEEVLLCWRSDEEEVSFYHKTHEGYAGRKPIPVHLLNP